MTIRGDIKAKLQSLTALAGLTPPVTAVSPDFANQSLRAPYILYAIPDKEFDNAINGTCTSVDTDLFVTCIAGGVDAAENMAEAIRSNNTNPGTGMGPSRWVADSGRTIRTSLIKESTGKYIYPDGTDSGNYAVDMQFRMMFTQTP